MIDYADESLAEAAAAYGRIEGFVTRAVELVGVPADASAVPDDFAASMDDDLGVPGAVAVLHNTVREGNTALAASDKEGAATALASVLAMLDVLGLNPLAAPGAASDSGSGAICGRSWTPWSRSRWSSGRRPGNARTSPRQTHPRPARGRRASR